MSYEKLFSIVLSTDVVIGVLFAFPILSISSKKGSESNIVESPTTSYYLNLPE